VCALEDAAAGIEAGKAAGARVVAVGKTHTAAELACAEGVAPEVRACSLGETDKGIAVNVTVHIGLPAQPSR
jgi:mannitol-1-/sugar-/sorbitol-6-phosphatase